MSDRVFRLDYYACREVLAKRLAEPAPGRIQLLAGPRQVGKTALLLDMAEQAGNQAVSWRTHGILARAFRTGEKSRLKSTAS